MTVFLLFLFSLEVSRGWAISLFGKEYFDKYLTHSLAGPTSFLRVLGSFVGIYGLETGTSKVFFTQHQSIIATMQKEESDLKKAGFTEQATKFWYRLIREIRSL